MVLILRIVCSILAIYMTTKQVISFIENDDATAIHFRRFNLSPNDKYPVFSICFTGLDLYWYKARSIYNAFGLSPSQFEAMLKGKEVFRYDYNYTKMLYRKIPPNVEDFRNIDTKQLSLKISEILTGLEFETDDPMSSIRYGSGRQGREVENIPLYVGHNTPDTICFTRTSTDFLSTLRVFDSLTFDKSIFGHEKYKDVDLQIFIHYPQQLIRSLHKPIFKSKVGPKKSKYDSSSELWDKLLKITIYKVTIFIKRSGSNIPCDEELENDDGKFRRQIITIIKCVPPYWTRLEGINSSVSTCNTVADLRNAHEWIQNYKKALGSYLQPCTQMEILGKFDREENNEWEDPRIKFAYENTGYEEMKNTKSFDFESFVSGVGGFIGIFLGYSILQIPDLLELLPSLNFNLGRKNRQKKFLN